MSWNDRQSIIKELEDIRGSKIVTHIHSDRRTPPGQPVIPGLQTVLATEAQPFFNIVLKNLGLQSLIELFLHTSGGQTDAVWPLVSSFREFGEKFNVLVPHKAHSAGTLICLGADNLVLGISSELSPVDPKTGNQFNPLDDVDKNVRRAISVEEVTSYFDLAKDPSKSGSNNGVNIDLAFQILASQVHPLALGNVNRSHKQIRELAKRLLKLHINGKDQSSEDNINSIVNALTQGRYSHTDIINRREAKELLGDSIVRFPSEKEQILMDRLLNEYNSTTSMLKTFSLLDVVGNNPQTEFEIVSSFLESSKESYIFRSKMIINQWSQLPPGIQINIQPQPNQFLPIFPGLPRNFNIEILEMSWSVNDKEI